MLCAKFGWNWPHGSGKEFYFNSVNVILLFRNYFLLEKGVTFYLNKIYSPFHTNALCQVWLKLVPWFWRRIFFNYVNIFLLFPNYLSLEMGIAIHLNRCKSLSLNDALCQIYLKLAPWFWRKRLLKIVYFVLFFPWKEAGPFIWTNLNHIHQIMLCAKFSWN